MSGLYVWSVILGLGALTYAIRFSFIGLGATRTPSPLVQRLLRYVPTAVIPAMVAPMVAFDRQAGVAAEPHVWLAAGLALAVGAATRNLVATLAAGMAAFHLLRAAGL